MLRDAYGQTGKKTCLDSVLQWHQNGSKMVGLKTMTTTLTLKNVPADIYERLKWSAQTHRRSLNSEAILCLESVLLPARVNPDERLARARTLREKLGADFRPVDIDKLKRAGRA